MLTSSYPVMENPQTAPLRPWERWALAGFFIFWLGFAGLVELRSAFLSRRMGDLDCFLRAAWAVRTGADPYAVTDNNGFHYNYPPFLAILLTPLADPPAGADTAGLVPFAVSVTVCYVLNLLLLAVAVHLLAGALEERISGWAGARWGRRWWALRIGPILLCVIPIAHTAMRGQSNLLVLALLCGSLAALLKERRFLSGVALAFAMCIKIFPAFLILFPLWRRDGRCLLGCAAGGLIALGLVPLAAMGPQRTVECYTRLAEVLILPGLGGGSDTTRAEELTNVTATDSQSLLAVAHKTMYLKGDRPAKASPTLRLVTTAVCGLLTLITLLAAGWQRSRDPISIVCLFGCLVLNMLLLCPVCHLHYFSLAVPLVMALMAARWQARPRLGLAWLALGIVVTIAFTLPNLPDSGLVRDTGLAMQGGLLLWTLGIVALCRRRRQQMETGSSVRPPSFARAA